MFTRELKYLVMVGGGVLGMGMVDITSEPHLSPFEIIEIITSDGFDTVSWELGQASF